MSACARAPGLERGPGVVTLVAALAGEAWVSLRRREGLSERLTTLATNVRRVGTELSRRPVVTASLRSVSRTTHRQVADRAPTAALSDIGHLHRTLGPAPWDLCPCCLGRADRDSCRQRSSIRRSYAMAASTTTSELDLTTRRTLAVLATAVLVAVAACTAPGDAPNDANSQGPAAADASGSSARTRKRPAPHLCSCLRGSPVARSPSVASTRNSDRQPSS